nr:GNAT family N-acetyltransferase [Bacteroidota bacterium]
MKDLPEIKAYSDFAPNDAFAMVGKIYQTSPYLSDDFHRKFPSIHAFKAYAAHLLSQPGSLFLVAVFGKTPVGYLTLEVNPASRLTHTAWLHLGILPEYQNRGVGRELITKALFTAEKATTPEIIYIMVRSDHEAAIGLYRSLGFTNLAVLDKDTKIGNYYFDGLLMRRFVNVPE